MIWWGDGSLPIRLQVIAIAISLLLLLLIIYLVRRERLKEGYSIAWLIVAIAMVIFSLHADLLDWFSKTLGISYAPAALLLISVLGLFLLSINFSLLFCRYDRRIRNLAQEHALLKEELMRDRLKK
jgi:hypothetical protein